MKKLIYTLIISVLTFTSCSHEPIQIHFDGTNAQVVNNRSDIKVKIDEGAHLSINAKNANSPIEIILSGQSDNGSIYLKSNVETHIALNNLKLNSMRGAAIDIHGKGTATIEAYNNTDNELKISSCSDTSKYKSSALWAKNDITICGQGNLRIVATGDGCKGINARNNLDIKELNLDIHTSGNNLGVDTTNHFGPGMPPMNPPEGFDPDNIPDEVKKMFEEMMKNGGPQGFGPHGGPQDGHPDGHQGFGPMKQKYIATTKGIKCKGIITIHSGNVKVTTETSGAEGIEGKKGVIINGGIVDVNAYDDGINANSTITFAGGDVKVVSTHNDAVDANTEGGFPMPPFGKDAQKEPQQTEPGIIISGGKVLAYSQIGAPEEGFDCDFAPILVKGGTALSIGGGMGPMPSAPTEKTAEQPTVLFSGVDYKANEKFTITSSDGEIIYTDNAPFDFQRSATIFTSPQLQIGKSYTLSTGDKTYEVKLDKAFSTSPIDESFPFGGQGFPGGFPFGDK